MLQKLQISKTTTFSESSGRQLSHEVSDVQIDIRRLQKPLDQINLVVLESPEDGGVFILCSLHPVNRPGLDQQLNVFLLQHLHGDPGQGRPAEAHVQPGEDLLGEI